MIIREADLEKDALAIADGARDFAEKMGLGGLISGNFVEALSRVIGLSEIKIYIAEHDGFPVGGLGVNYAPYMWNQDLLIADELFWWVDENAPYKTAVLLFNKAMLDIDESGALPMFRALLTSSRGVEKMYKKHGMMPVETLYARIT
jgi:hypothetical protein